MLDLKQREKQKKKNAAAAVTRVSNTKAKVSKTTTKMDTPHSEKSTRNLFLVTVGLAFSRFFCCCPRL